MKLLLSLVSLGLLTSCGIRSYNHSPITPIQTFDNIQEVTASQNRPFITLPQQEHYSICHSHSCAEFAYINLSKQQWQTVEVLFTPLAANAEQERKQIKSAIALLESMTGQQAGTNNDLAKNGHSFGTRGQLDCIDEATNTTVYLRLLSNSGLLKMHLQASRTSRGGLIAPHNTATILETNSNTRYAVDSWFYANGEPPVILPLSIWKSGWKPEND